MRASISLIVLLLAATACGAAQPSGESVGATPSPSVGGGSSPSADPTVEPSASAPSASEEPEVSITTDSIALTAADGLRLRAEPGQSGEQVGTLPAGVRLFVISGPEQTDDDPSLAWWEVSAFECGTACGDRSFGWVSSGPDGAWLEPAQPNCPSSFPPETLFEVAPTELLACFGNEPIELEGILDYWCCEPATFGQTDPAWLAAWAPGRLRVSAEADSAAWGPIQHVNPASDVELGERGSVVHLTGHFDDPVAQECVTTIAPEDLELNPQLAWVTTPSLAVFGCRTSFVVDTVELLDTVLLPTPVPQG